MWHHLTVTCCHQMVFILSKYFYPYSNIFSEYEFLDSKLDELNSALDFLEQKNDDIHKKLKELLQSNIDIRQQLKDANATNEN